MIQKRKLGTNNATWNDNLREGPFYRRQASELLLPSSINSLPHVGTVTSSSAASPKYPQLQQVLLPMQAAASRIFKHIFDEKIPRHRRLHRGWRRERGREKHCKPWAPCLLQVADLHCSFQGPFCGAARSHAKKILYRLGGYHGQQRGQLPQEADGAAGDLVCQVPTRQEAWPFLTCRQRSKSKPLAL